MPRRPGPNALPARTRLAGALLAAALGAGPAHAQCPAHPLTTTTSANPLTSALVVSTDFDTPQGFIASGPRLEAFDPANGAWLWTVTLSDTIRGTPLPARLEGGLEVVYVCLFGCKIDCRLASNGGYVWERNLQVPPGDIGDGLAQSPAFWPRAASDSAFRAAVPNDLVMVATRFVATYNNRLYALNALDGSNRWVFNLTGTSNMNASAGRPTLDLARDAVYVGTEQASPTQNSLWAFSSTNGLRKWTGFGIAAGRITTPPLLVGERLYTAGPDNTVRATRCGPTPGTLAWTLPLASPVVSDLALDDTSVQPLLVMRSADHALRFVVDEGTFAAETPPMSGYVDGPICVPGTGKCLAVNSAGGVQEIDVPIQYPVGPPAVICGGPAGLPALARIASLPDPWRLSVVTTATGGGNLTQLCVPWTYGQQPTGCLVDVPPGGHGGGAGVPGARLAVPYPNPAHGSTRLSFRTDHPARAELIISDIQGRLVRRFAESQPASGERSVMWSGDDESARRLASGLYTVRLLLDGRAEDAVRKVLVLR